MLVEEISGKIEGKFLLCNYCRGMLRDACLTEKDGRPGVACSLCISKDTNKQIAQLNRETVNEKQVSLNLYKLLVFYLTLLHKYLGLLSIEI